MTDSGDPSDGSTAASSDEVDYGGISGLREFFGETTMHGVQYTFRGGLLLRFVWLLGVLGCLCGFFYFFITAAINYAGFPSNTKVDIITADSLPTPAITICNSNVALASGVAKSLRNLAFLCRTYNLTVIDDARGCPFTAQQRDTLTESDTRLPAEIIQEIGQSKENMVLDELVRSLSTNGTVYTYENSSSFITFITALGLCHTYNADGRFPYQTTIGVNGGRRFIINVNQNEYAGITLLSAGVEVYIHNPGELVQRGQHAIYVGPGQRANIAVKPARRHILGSPYRTPPCTNENLNRDKSLPYSPARCELDCQNQYIAEECECLPLTVSAGVTLTLPSGRRVSRYCSVQEYFSCSSLLDYAFHNNVSVYSECRSRCLLPCEAPPNTYIYGSALSWDLFPNFIASELIIEVLTDFGLYDNPRNITTNLQLVRENFAQINVFYESLSYERIDEQVSVTLSTLFGSVGGNLGLFIGASMLTLLEFGQYITRFFIARFRRLRRQEKDIWQKDDASNDTALDDVVASS
eukprot:scpid45734/ scgid16157/ Acid-sensing ion channel 1; Amiloride-sensitive cation channel 2, neuronal; Brain sodium channel 2